MKDNEKNTWIDIYPLDILLIPDSIEIVTGSNFIRLTQ